jgi:hypothetical protein
MDQPHSHITPCLTLRGENIPGVFPAHPDLPPVTVKLLRLQYDDYLRAGDSRRTTKLARLSASHAAGHLAAELNKRNREGKYLRQTVSAELWRDPDTRRQLQRMLRDYPQRRLALASFRMAAHDEASVRAFQLAKLLIEQVELAAQPLRPEEVDRLIDYERQRAENFRRAGAGVLARLCEQKAAQLARDHEKDFRTEAERDDAMIRAAARRLVWHFAMRGDRLVARLVGEATGRVIDFRRVRYVSIGR